MGREKTRLTCFLAGGKGYLFIVGLIILHFHNSINEMRKNDLYNSFMFIITMISFIITVWTVVN